MEMRLRIGLSAAVVAAMLCCSASAIAANTYTLCATAAGKPLVSPAKSGTCAKGQYAIVLARAGALSSLQSQVTTLENQVSSLQSDDTSLTNRVSTLEGDNTSLTSRVSTLESDNTSLTNRVSTLESENTSLTNRVGTLESEMGSLQNTFSGVTRANNTLLFSGM